MSLRVGTRGSRLALFQTQWVMEALRAAHPGLDVELVVVQTTGDRILDAPLAKIGGKGVFTKEIEEALRDRRIDVAVHSLKDVPTAQPPGLALAAVTARESPWDLLLAPAPLDWWNLPPGLVLGTSSLRRQAMARSAGGHIRVADLRGNVPTRIEKMLRGDYGAILLAEAGVRRLGVSAPFMKSLCGGELLPAPGQGALGLQIRGEDGATRDLLAPLHDHASEACCGAERRLLHALGGGCQMPLGAHGELLADGSLRLRGWILTPDGSQEVRGEVTGAAGDWGRLGDEMAEDFLSRGAAGILSALDLAPDGFEAAVARSQALDRLPLGGLRVAVTRDEDSDGPLSLALRDLGAHPLCLPCVIHRPPADPGPLHDALKAWAGFQWMILTSARGVEALVRAEARPAGFPGRIAVVGRATAQALEGTGRKADLVAPGEDAASLLEELRDRLGSADKVLYPRANLARPGLVEGLRALGAEVRDPVAYETIEQPPVELLRAVLAEAPPAAVTFASPSAVRSFRKAMDAAGWAAEGVRFYSIGATTSEAMRAEGLEVAGQAAGHSFGELAGAILADPPRPAAKG